MTELPNGIVTFFLTDIEGSMKLWHEHGEEAMIPVIERHNAILTERITHYQGVCLKERAEGDSLFAVFKRATDAILAAGDIQRILSSESWPISSPVRVRIALHTDEAHIRENDYYGVAPGHAARLRAVGHGGQTLLCQTTYNLVYASLSQDITIRNLGLHSIKDWPVSQYIYQLVLPDQPADFGPLRTFPVNNLPQQLTSFIGRQQELEAIQRLLTTTRLLTLTGTGGAGKTRLALCTGERILDAYTDGVCLIELEALSDPALIPQTVVRALRLREQTGHSLTESIVEYLKPKHLLLLLDNCEHLVKACAEFAETLLKSCPDLWILCTSREVLGLTVEAPWQVPLLSLPDSGDWLPVEKLLTYEAIQLFVERARAKSPTFALTDQNKATVISICRKLDGLPFAIELAAAHVRTLELPKLAERLFRVLKNPSPTPLPHRETLWKTLDWSYALLTPQEQTLLCRLTVFAGGCALEAAEAICKSDDSLEDDLYSLLQQLVNKSLVVIEEHSEAGRYRLLETVREYAGNRIQEQGDAELLRDRHLGYFLDLAEEIEPRLMGAQQAFWLNRLEDDHDNLRAALDWVALERIAHNEKPLRLAAALWRFWSMRGHLIEGRARLENALMRFTDCSEALRAKALNGLGVILFRQGNHVAAQKHLEESLKIRRRLKEDKGIAECFNNLGNIARDQQRYEKAKSYFEKCLKISHKSGDLWEKAGSLTNLGTVAFNLCEYATAQSYYDQSLKLYRELGDIANIAAIANNLGVIANAQDDFHAARDYYEESLVKLEELKNVWAVAITLSNLAQVNYELKDFTMAENRFMQSLRMRHNLGDRSGMVYPLFGLGEVFAAQGDYGRATQLYAVAASVREMFGAPASAETQKLIDQVTHSAQTALGAEAFAKIWKEAASRALDQVINEFIGT